MYKYTIISLTHILLVGPGLIYLGKTIPSGNNSKINFNILLVLGILLLLSHSHKLYKNGISLGWIYALHVFIFSPIMLYVGLMKENSHYSSLYLLQMIGYSAIGMHGSKLLNF